MIIFNREINIPFEYSFIGGVIVFVAFVLATGFYQITPPTQTEMTESVKKCNKFHGQILWIRDTRQQENDSPIQFIDCVTETGRVRLFSATISTLFGKDHKE